MIEAAKLVTPVIPTIDFSDFISRLVTGHQGRTPLFGSLETTFRCNLNCIHCYVNEPVHDAPGAMTRELSIGRLVRLMDEIADQGCLNLLLTGGEVLVRPDFPELYRYAVRKGLLITVFTNGTLVTDEIVSLFKETPPQEIEITLYGMSQATYERITRVDGSFKACVQGIMRLCRADIPLRLKTMVMDWNIHELTAMRTFSQNLGLPFRHDGLLNPRVDGYASPIDKLQLPAEQLSAIDIENPTLRKRLQDGICSISDRPPTTCCNPIFTCGAGMVAFNVDPYGRLQLCQLARKSFFDLQDDSFANGWIGFLPTIRFRLRSKSSVCDHCTLSSFCVCCPGTSELEHGDPEKPVARFCRITHARMQMLLGDIPGHLSDASCCLKQNAIEKMESDICCISSCEWA